MAYIDGFNLYFGLKEKKWNQFYWLNLLKLSELLLKENQQLIKVKYFTSKVRNNPEKEKRQRTYIEALETLDNFEIFYGKYQDNFFECKRCGIKYSTPNEKMTDVNIAVEMLSDAYANAYDAALLISGDSDLIPPIKPKLTSIC